MQEEPAPGPPRDDPPRRILFVDDDPLILRSIARSMRAAEPGWDILVTGDPSEALSVLDASPVDVLVSDLNMKELDGAALLVEAQRRRPETVRIVLSAMVDPKHVFRTVPIAHQFLTKPFEVGDLRARLRSAIELGGLLKNERLRALVASDNTLPVVPGTFAELSTVVSDPGASVGDMARVVEKDTALSAELIRLVSSSFFGLPRQVHGVRAAIAYLGVEMLKALVLEVEIARAFRASDAPEGFDIEELQSHALSVARAARRLTAGTRHAEDAFTAGILHDVGQLVLASRAPAEFGRALALAKEAEVPLADAERELLGVSHAEVGAYLLGIWGLRQSLVLSVALHHEDPSERSEGDVTFAVQRAELECAVEASDAGPGVVSGPRPSGFLRTSLATGTDSASAATRFGGPR